MKTSNQLPGHTHTIQPSADFRRKPTVEFTFVAMLVSLFMMLFNAPSARAQGVPPGCTGSAIGISLFTSAPDVHVGDTLFYSISVFNGIVGNPTSCDASNIVAWITTPDGLSNRVTLRRTYLTHAQGDFYTNVVSYVVRAQDIRPDGTVRATAEDTAVIYQNDTPSNGGANQGVNTEVSLPSISVTAQCLGSIGENNALTFSGTVTNSGNNTLVGVTITAFVNGGQFPVTFITNLARGQIAAFSGTWIPTNPCVASTILLTVGGVDQFTTFPRTVTSSASTTCSQVLTPGILVTKSCPALPVSPGQLLIFSGTVSNTGNVTLTNIVVVNNQPVANTPVFILSSLAPGAVAIFSGSYTAPTNCSVADTLTATGSSRCGVLVTSLASATCPILTTPQIALTMICPVTPAATGGTLTYSGSVRNAGNITLSNIVVVSDRPVANTTVFTVASLAPGASANFTSSLTVPADACSITTTFGSRGQDACTPTMVTNTVATTCPIITAPAMVVTLACPLIPANTGGPIVYTGTVRNSGNVTLTNVFVVNNQPGPGSPVIGPITLAPGATANFNASFTAPIDACSVTSIVTGTGNDGCTSLPVSNTASATCTLNSAPSIFVTQFCPITPSVPGGLLTYSGTVSNSGTITLTNVVVLNNLSGATPIFTTTALAPGAVVNFTGSYLAPTNCSVTSVSTATGRSTCGVAVTNTASATCTIVTAPQILVTAVCPITPILPGGSLTYSGTVRNNGNITLTNVVVVSDQPVANTTVFTIALLAPGASANFTGVSTVPANACSVTATFRGTGKDLCTLVSVTNTVSTTCAVTTAPAITATLTCPIISASVGGPIVYAGTVRNSGNVTLTNVFVVNNQPGPGSPVIGPITLAPGATVNFTTSFTAPLDACSVSSTVNVTGNDNCTGITVANTASATCTLLTVPNIIVTQVCPLTPTVPGTLLIYTGTVRNAGNITLTNVVVVNNLSGATPIFTVATLAPGAVSNFTGSYVAPTNCSVTSISTATGRSICGIGVTNTVSSTCAILTAPAIVVTELCPITPVLPGGLLTYSGTVSNSGNIILTNVIVVSDRPGANTVIFTLASLAPGARANFTGSYITHSDCCVDSSTLRASGQGCDGTTVADSVTRTCTLITSPRLVVTKICPPGTLRPGDLLTYSGIVSNAGTITLINVSMANSQGLVGSPFFGPVTMAPGEWFPYTASYIVPVDFCGTDTVTAIGLDVCTFLPVVNSVTTTCPITTTPRIVVTKNCPIVPTPRGGLYTYTGTVSNPGNVTLTNVFVIDNQPALNTPVLGPITLAPGASMSFSASFVAPNDCCQIIDTVSARGQDRCSGSTVASTATTVCPLLTTPGLALMPNCQLTPILLGTLYQFSGYITNTGDVVLTNVIVFGPLGTNNPVLGPIELAPGEREFYTGSFNVPLNTCAVSLTASGQAVCGSNVVANASASCPVATTPAISVSETCPPGPVTAGSLVNFGGLVSNTGNITLTNVLVFGSQSGNIPVLGPITLAPGASAPFNGSYIATGGSSPTTNVTIVTHGIGSITTNVVRTILTNSSSTVTTNAATPTSFATLNPVSHAVVDRFGIGTNFSGLTYAGEDHGYGATMLYAMRKDITGVSFFDTIIPSTATTTDRFSATTRNFDALTYASPDLGYGPVIFYYLSHDSGGVSSFGSITPGGVVGVVADRFVVGSGFDALTFAATDVGFGANLFYYVRHDASGLSTFGTINPALPGTVTDRFTVGNNVDAIVFSDLTSPGFGANNFYYVRHDAGGVSTFGTIFVTSPTTAAVTDRFTVGSNARKMTFTATDVGFGANQFYILRGQNFNVSTNVVTTYITNTVITLVTNSTVTFTTNTVVSLTSTNTVTALGQDPCQNRTVVAVANCLGPVSPTSFAPVVNSPRIFNGFLNLSFTSQMGIVYTVQYKNSLGDPAWTDLGTVMGTGGNLSVAYPISPAQPMRFFRIIFTQ